jgi:DNA-directed RNA polymerase subunit beta'
MNRKKITSQKLIQRNLEKNNSSINHITHLKELEKLVKTLETTRTSFNYLKIQLASPQRVKSWAERILPCGMKIGKILSPDTVNFRTLEPETNGLFCQVIFGPLKNWTCQCGQYNGAIVEKICEKCNVELTENRVRRYRMGYLQLVYPVPHYWYFTASPNYLVLLLSCFYSSETFSPPLVKEDFLKVEDLISYIYGHEDNDIIPPFFFENYLEKYLRKNIKTFLGKLIQTKERLRLSGEVIKAALEDLNLNEAIHRARGFYFFSENYTKPYEKLTRWKKITIRQIRILESFLASETNPAWLVLTNLAILPPNLRPLVELENGLLIASDLNEMYRTIIHRNQRLSDFFSIIDFSPEFVVESSQLLQTSIDCLIDNARLPKDKQFFLNDRILKSLTEILEGKQGRFRQSLLGKRVDYSGRSVIVVGPSLRLNQCGLPYLMAKELFHPFLINYFLKEKIQSSFLGIKYVRWLIKLNQPLLWKILTRLTKKYSILLNRAPTLHRFGIQAFDPVLMIEKAIYLHPLVCNGFNADFDGDQMAVHLPLYNTTQLEAKTMMRPSGNIFSPANGEAILKPTQDMIIGFYYLTMMNFPRWEISQKYYSNEKQALKSFFQKKITLHTPILVRYCFTNFSFTINNEKLSFFNPLNYLISEKKNISVFEKINVNQKIYFLTSIGILCAVEMCPNQYVFTELFLETTPGRLIFGKTFQTCLFD